MHFFSFAKDRPKLCQFNANAKVTGFLLSGCNAFQTTDEHVKVCWLCGKNRRSIVGEFGKGKSSLLEEFTWAGMCFPCIPPVQRPCDYGLHGVHKNLHDGLTGVTSGLVKWHGWSKLRAHRWVQWFLDPIRVDSRTAIAEQCEVEGEAGSKALRLEQAVAALWLKKEGWDCMADHLRDAGLLQNMV